MQLQAENIDARRNSFVFTFFKTASYPAIHSIINYNRDAPLFAYCIRSIAVSHCWLQICNSLVKIFFMFSPPPPKSEVSLEFSSQKLLWAFLSYAHPTNTTIETTTLNGLLTEEQKEMAPEMFGAVNTTDWKKEELSRSVGIRMAIYT